MSETEGMTKMKKHLLAGVASLAVVGPALATDAPAPHATMQEQADCHQRADAYYQNFMKAFSYNIANIGPAPASFVSHYNLKLGVCFAEINVDRRKPMDRSITLVDVIGDRSYGNYFSAWGGAPIQCQVDEDADSIFQPCKSEDEFRQMAAHYMND